MKKPKYAVIVDEIKEKIEKGEWPIGSKIPSQRNLAEIFQVNRSTVITALDELMAEGLIEGRVGSGTIVTNNTWTLMGQQATVNWNENVSKGIHKASMTMVQEINREESNDQLIQLSKGELAAKLFPTMTMQSVMRKVSDQFTTLGYEEPKGNILLRQAISNYLKVRGIDASPSSILVVSGALQALHLISIGLLPRGTSVLLEKPSYLYSLSIFQSAGMELKGLSMDREGVKIQSISQLQKEKQILYTIPSFHNPTGITMSDKRRLELLEKCKKEQLPIVEDDVYRDLWIDNEPPVPLKAMDHSGNVLYLGSLSKSLSPGLRIGWIVGPESVINRLADLKMQSDYGSSAISQRVAAEWLTSGLYEEHLKNVRGQLRIRRSAALQALNTYLSNVAEWDVPEGGFFIWLRIKPDFTVSRLFDKAMARGILLNPGNIYAEDTGQFIRLSYAFASPDDFRKGVSQLSKIFQGAGEDYYY
ncbi:MocR-like pyridoxine biosynthesis transcription factor PdxR [Sporosarcina obsidiansis]|uniref:MocR-like pyridoxine biosynthesis transcription factor PdxR n=1 Tax=Sporosarcina obsidiansis TaxID=2660748 RepID=UPI00129B2247|nr:PLP-dependent aminotransferase family protein [Sporosarcina obsidiansis]